MKTLTVPADVDRLGEVNAFVDEMLQGEDCTEAARYAIELAVEEVFVNIASYAYQTGDGGTEEHSPEGPDSAEENRSDSAEVRCEILHDPLRVSIQFLDNGVPYDPTAKEDADTSPEGLRNRVGGLGILLVRRTMDEVWYAREDGKNILTIMKRL